MQQVYHTEGEPRNGIVKTVMYLILVRNTFPGIKVNGHIILFHKYIIICSLNIHAIYADIRRPQ